MERAAKAVKCVGAARLIGKCDFYATEGSYRPDPTILRIQFSGSSQNGGG